MTKTWLFWNDVNHPPQENMDIDERLLRESAKLDNKPLIRFYGWDRPAVSVGYVQKIDIIQDDKYEVVKRPTGGGVVYHDRDFTYTVVVPPKHWIAELDRVESYRVIHKALVRAFAKFGVKGILVETIQAPAKNRATMQCFVTPTKYDVLCELRNGKTAKCAGSAQRRTKNGILHQGSIVLDMVGGDSQKLAIELKKAIAEEFNIIFQDFILQ